MEDPVILPTSNISLDRETIEYYLELSSIDPFNKKPLTKEQLIPNIELKKRINEYRIKKLNDLPNNEVYKGEVNKKDNFENEEEDIQYQIKNKKIINYDDAPEEFIDILTCEIMEDPVILPTSKINLDRKTIEYH